MYSITKEFTFAAAHVLQDLEQGHPCMRYHGHNYVVVLELRSDKLNAESFIKDYRKLDDFKKWIDSEIDHRSLNEVLPYGLQTSAENIAKWIYDNWKGKYPELYSVIVKETPKTTAKYWVE